MTMEMPEPIVHLANDLLLWTGFGTLVGLLAKAILPGRDPGGALATLLVGIGGSVVGCGTLMFFWSSGRVTPLSLIGFLAATGGTLILLISYRLLAGRLFREEGTGPKPLLRLPRRRRQPVALVREE